VELGPCSLVIRPALTSGFFINIQPDFSSGGNFTLEKVESGSSTRVRATLLSPVQQTFTIRGNEETQVGYRFETNGEVVDFGQGRLVITLDVAERAGEARRTVIETGQDALGGLSLRETLDAALINANTGTPFAADDVYHAIIDSYNTSPGSDPSLPHCDDRQTNGQASLNGYPLACPRIEGSQFDNLDSWFPIAFVNRLDLAPTDGSNCGQQRIIFANNLFIGNGRMLMIIEAQLPNPTPECGVDSCRPIAEFWSSLAAINDPVERGKRLRDAFLTTGTGPFGPFMNANQLGPGGGQIRTNNFNSFPWTMREFQMQAAPATLPLPTPCAKPPTGNSGMTSPPCRRARPAGRASSPLSPISRVTTWRPSAFPWPPRVRTPRVRTTSAATTTRATSNRAAETSPRRSTNASPAAGSARATLLGGRASPARAWAATSNRAA
jgi:hypothetical protein